MKISDCPRNGESDYSHMIPIVEFLLSNGNVSANEYIWGNNRTGYFCYLVNDIDFEDLDKNFIFPESMHIDVEKQIIDCVNTYTLIRKIL